jgi:hypothetical protein
MIESPNPTAYGQFGEVATDSTYLVIGADGEGTPEESGKAYVYTLSDLSVTPLILTSSNPEYSGGFGNWGCVAINDGTIVIGAPYEEDFDFTDAGHAYIFNLAS